MENVMVYPEALKNAAAELKKRSAEWIAGSECINSEECRSALEGCGKIIEDYALLLEKISVEYEESGNRISAFAGEIYEQL